MYITVYYINANLTVLITEAQSNVGNFSKPGGEMGVRPNTLYTPPIFPQLRIYFMIKNRQIIFPKGVYRTPKKMHSWMYTFTSIVLLNVETVLSALMNV
jgi:hypothetical protein